MIELASVTGLEIPANPFPGLRPFEFNERLLYFGRDGQSEQLIRKLSAIRFVAVVGTSGSGKSSLVRAGLLPALFSGFMASAGSDWRIAVLRPGNDPLGNLARALNAPDVFGPEDPEQAGTQAAITEAALRRGSLGLIEVVRQARMAGHESMLVVVDQFEEIFRFARVTDSEQYQNEAAGFVKLLLEASRQRELPIYIVLTMRSDFLGDCSIFWDLPEAINAGQYLIPRMTREQRREAITGPIAICGGEATPRLMTRLLNDMGSNPDQLPILQHALMRTWNKWKESAGDGEPLDLQHYEAIGTMENALSLHADEAYEELPDEPGKKIAENIFKALTDKGADNRETRRPTELKDLCALVEAEEAEVVKVIDTFRREGRSFLMPPAGVALHSGSLIDISHESLIRNWKRLKQWVEEDARSARIYRRLAETARLYGKGEAGLWRDPDLQLALQWREQNSPNAVWAERYDADFDNAMKFLDESRAARDKEAEEKEAHRKNQIKRNRLFMIVLAVACVVSCGLGIYAWQKRQFIEGEKKRVQQLLYLADMKTGHESFALNSIPRAVEALDAHVDDELRGFEWYHLWWLLHGDLATLDGHRSLVRAVAISPDGKILASGSADSTIKLWDLASHEEIATLRGHRRWVNSLAFSPDGKMLASGGADSQIKLWDVASHEEMAGPLAGNNTVIHSLAFSPDGKTLASGGFDNGSKRDHMIKLWDVASRAVTATLEGHRGVIYSLAFSPAGAMLASGGGDRVVKLWNLASPGKPVVFEGYSKRINSVAFSPDGETLASGSDDGVVKLWDVASSEERGALKERSRVLSVAFSPDRKTIASGGDDSQIKLWDLATGEQLITFKGHSDMVSSIAFSPDGKIIASGSDDHMIKLWDAVSHDKLYAPVKGHSKGALSVAFSPDGKTLASSSRDRTIKLWDVASHASLRTLQAHNSAINSIAFSPDGKTLASGADDTHLKLWDLSSGEVIVTRRGHGDSSVNTVAFSPGGDTLASGGKDGVIKLWYLSSQNGQPTLRERATLEGHEGVVYSVAFSPDGERLASGGDDSTVRLWDVASGKEIARFEGHDKWVMSVAFSPDGETLASGGSDNTVRLWDIASRRELATLRGHTNSVLSLSFSPDGRTLASGGDESNIKLWDVGSRNELATFKGESKAIRSVAFSPDGRTLASGSEASATEDGIIMLRHSATEEDVTRQRKQLQLKRIDTMVRK